jgi:hypothetical protein
MTLSSRSQYEVIRFWSWSIASPATPSTPPAPFRFFDHLARFLHHLPGDAVEFAVFGQLLLVPLAGAHAFEFLHPAARTTSAIGKTSYPLG